MRKPHPGVSGGTRKLLRPSAFVDSRFGKRDAGEPHAEVHQFRVDAGVEVDIPDAAAEVADVELGLGDGGYADGLMVSAREDLGCAAARLHHRAVERVALRFRSPV